MTKTPHQKTTPTQQVIMDYIQHRLIKRGGVPVSTLHREIKDRYGFTPSLLENALDRLVVDGVVRLGIHAGRPHVFLFGGK